MVHSSFSGLLSQELSACSLFTTACRERQEAPIRIGRIAQSVRALEDGRPDSSEQDGGDVSNVRYQVWYGGAYCGNSGMVWMGVWVCMASIIRARQTIGS